MITVFMLSYNTSFGTPPNARSALSWQPVSVSTRSSSQNST
jgi:hypothetical protein